MATEDAIEALLDVIAAQQERIMRLGVGNSTTLTGDGSENREAVRMAKEQKTARDTDIVREGTKIILPAKPKEMTYKEAREVLERKEREEEQDVAVNEVVEVYPQDGAIAAAEAMREIFGWAEMISTPSFFGPQPPAMVSIRTGPAPTDTVSIPWGRFSLPGVVGWIHFGVTERNNRQVFQIQGQVKQKSYGLVHKLAERTREIAAEKSIYRRKALLVDFEQENWLDQITFIDVSRVKPDELILPEAVQAQVETSIFAPILYAEQCKRFGVPQKRGILLEGPYGTGKTMVAYIAAKHAVNSGRTFIYVKDSRQLASAFEFAQQYAPAVLFCEDIDRVVGGKRDREMDNLANVIDGLTAKESELLLVLTTNDVSAIHPVMLRPGRLDAIISVSPPDAAAAARLIQLYGRGLVRATPEELLKVGELLDGQIPAMIRECVERAKLSAIYRQQGIGEPELTAEDLTTASMSLANQQRLLAAPAPPPTKGIDAELRAILGEVIKTSEIPPTLEKILNEVT